MENIGPKARFVPRSKDFIRRTRLVNGLLGSWSLVVGTGSWLEAHLAARLALATRQPNLKGCGITAKEVEDLVNEEVKQQGRPPLVILVDSLEHDHGLELMRRLRRRHAGLLILFLVQNDDWLTPESLVEIQAQAIVHVHSFGSGTVIRALQTLRRGQSYLDPSLQQRLMASQDIDLSGRERQVLEGLVRGHTNKQIALECEIAATTVRDYVGSLCRKLKAANRTQLVSRAYALGLLGPGRGRSQQTQVGQGPEGMPIG